MRLYNSLTGTLDRFRPRPGSPVGVYVCGITPYDTTHLGHAFTYVVFDVLIRHLETVHAWPVRYVQNVTDIDDDILRKAAEVGADWRSLGDDWTRRFVHDMRALNTRPPDVYPAATGAVADIQRLSADLIAAGAAYARDGSVYLRFGSLPDPGEGLLRAAREELLAVANERGNDPTDPRKEDPLDAVLWQAGAPGEPAWRSPWGLGRPGWHVECAAMAQRHLGATVDVHGGGDDLRFPHHAGETATVAPLQDEPFVRAWVHCAMVRKDGEKMAKSLGNLVMVARLLKAHHPDTIRLYLLGHHYRVPWEWDERDFLATEARVRTLHGAMERTSGTGRPLDPAIYGPRFSAALDDDLNTPAAVEAALALADAILGASAATDVHPAQDVLRTLAGRVLGLWLRPVENGELGAPWPAPLAAAPDVVSL